MALKNKVLNTIGVISLSALIASCSYWNKPEVKDFKGYSEIRSGEKATMNWEFLNTAKVKIAGVKETFPAKGSYAVAPDSNSSFKFTAVSEDYLDSLKKEWVINVKQEIKVGPTVNPFAKLKKSIVPSEYLKGLYDSETPAPPSRIKVLGSSFGSAASPKECVIRFLALDEFGSYIKNLNKNGQIKVKIVSNDDSVNKEYPVNSISEKWSDAANEINYAVVLDNSYAAEQNRLVMEQLSTLAEEMELPGEYYFSYFNHKTEKLSPVTAKGKTDFRTAQIPNAGGFNSVYRSAFKAINEIAKKNDKPGALILVVSNSDNSSLIYTANDIAKLAKKKGVPIYIISLGAACNSLSYSYLSDYTGGKYYFLDNNEAFRVKDIMREIIFSHNAGYEVRFALDNEAPLPKELFLEMEYIQDLTLLKDKFRVINGECKELFDYQALCGFEVKSTSIGEDYDANIKDFAEVMMDNPKLTVELVGNAGIEGSESQINELALKRAQSARQALVKYGVPQERIRVSSDGCNKPIYYIEQYNWQSYYNRRVDVKWIIPENLPFEILAENAESEESAEKYVINWEKLGYKSYYERYLQNNSPIYRVKIWGYPNQEEAEKVVTDLKKAFNLPFSIRIY